MREHKYRFYYKGKLIEELTLKEIGAKCEFHWADDVDVAEYTGCKDKCGVEVFEGDIIQRDEEETLAPAHYWENCVVVWRRAMWTVVFWGEEESLDDYVSNTGEVIGNKYENPELLK